jgi:hypothetical protein
MPPSREKQVGARAVTECRSWFADGRIGFDHRITQRVTPVHLPVRFAAIARAVLTGMRDDGVLALR